MQTTVKFLRELPKYEVEQPYELYGYPMRESEKITNCEFEYVRDLKVENARPSMKTFKLRDSGFEFVHHQTKIAFTAENFESAGNQSQIVNAYLEETMAMVKKKVGASDVVCFDWRVSIPPQVDAHTLISSLLSVSEEQSYNNRDCAR
jgi:hypothetical protein